MDHLRSTPEATEGRTSAEPTGSALLALARASIRHALGGPKVVLPEGDVYTQRAATFVTVMFEGQVHGCIGVLEPVRPLVEDVVHNAVAAALHDPRSRPLRIDELARVQLEISVLSALDPVEVSSQEDAAHKLRPGVDGVVLRYGSARATFLPQVWEKLPNPDQFLTELRRKAGLSHWPAGVCVYRYTVQKYEEERSVGDAADAPGADVGATTESAPLAHA